MGRRRRRRRLCISLFEDDSLVYCLPARELGIARALLLAFGTHTYITYFQRMKVSLSVV